ncbi:hypothetical protein HGRIS_012720 [Hohenbuehelia grisea]|uniref:Phospholipid-transporting ATPase n=1 Tax=Hohenbuehelia grisea TaxID=104357 RepID=A0ABR3IT50_9AGAR
MAPTALSRLGAWYAKLAAFNVEELFVKKRPPGPPRTVFVNEHLPDDYLDHKGNVKPEHVYVTNQVITSKYTIITFLPRNLLEQFRRIANVFFLGIAILQFFPKFSTISPGLVIFPLLVVLTITALKDGYEDVKRHNSDRRVNQSKIRVLSGGDWVNTNAMTGKSKTFVRGLVPKGRLAKKAAKLKGGLSAEMLEGVTAPAHPGEPPDHEHDIEFDDDDQASTDGHHRRHSLFGHNEPTRPHWRKTMWEDVRVGDYVKILDNESFPADILICATSEDENVAFVETKNLDGETNLKSRNAVSALTHLRNAAECASKMNTFRIDCDRPDNNMYRLNAAVKAGKETFPVDMQMTLLRGTVLRNTRWVIGIVLFTGEDTKIVLNSGGTPSKRSKVERQMNPQVFVNLILLAMMAVTCAIADSILEHRDYPRDAPWLYNDNRPDDNPSINGLVTWAFALITFQNIVPISLYISIEFVRTLQAAFIYFDKEIWYEKTDQPTLARSWNLSDDLGQIEYIFSDKTGTLTQNSMVFRQCTIGGKAYRGDPHLTSEPSDEKTPIIETEKKQPVEVGSSHESSTTTAGDGTDSTNVPNPRNATGVKLSQGVLMHFSDATLKQDLEDSVAAAPGSENAAHARQLNGFFTVLSLCHTVLTSVDPETGAIEYKAQSPDEAALVQAAADVGYVFRGRNKEVLSLQTPFSDELEQYELLNILEFTSARKRMSVVLRKLDGDDGRLFLLTKGADNVIFERLRPGGDDLKAVTETHLDEFASSGLRTLTLAYKVIPEDEYEAWAERYHEATISLDDREERIESVSNELEQDLRLLGATAIEDRLQDGVPEAIADLKKAGIKIWVATGDKLETAIAIGHSTNLIAPESNIIIIRGGSRPVYEQLGAAADSFFPESDLLKEESAMERPSRHSTTSDGGERPHPLRRVNTGVSSIVGHDNGNRPGGFVLVIDGAALGSALADDHHKDLLLRLAMLCEGVICCRVSPLQKALVVKMVKDGVGAMTLAIGDGANDVSMIQAADVGVGISGEEGLQAVNSSDYAIGQFRFLKRLLLVHGHWSYARNGNMILNFFYKNVVCIGVLWWFQIYCGWSSNYVFEYTYLLFWNSFWTIAPVIGIGLFDRIVDDHVLMAIPELYRYGREGTWFGLKWFIIYMIDGIYQSAVIFFLVLYTYVTPTARTDGYDVYLYEFSTTMVIAAVTAACLYNGLNTNVWTGWVFFAVLVGIVLVWAYTAIYSIISPGWFYTPAFGNDHYLFRSAYFWFCLPLTIFIALLPRYIAKAWKFGYAPDDIDTMRYLHKVKPSMDIAHDARLPSGLHALQRPASVLSRRTSRSESVMSVPDPRRPSVDLRTASRTDMSTGLRSVHRGFDFATEENGVAMRRMQSNLSERRLSSRLLASARTGHHPSRREQLSHVFSIRRLKRKPPSPKKEQ